MTAKTFGTWIFFVSDEDDVMWSVLWAQKPVDCASRLKFVFIALLAQFHPIYTLLCLFLPRSGMAHKSRHPSRVIYLGDHSGSRGVELAGWAPRVGRSVYKSRPGQTSCPRGPKLWHWIRARGRRRAGAASWARAAQAANRGDSSPGPATWRTACSRRDSS